MGQQDVRITTSIAENEKNLRQMFSSCDDLKIRKFYVGKNAARECLICYIEVNAGNVMFNAIAQFISYLDELTEMQINQAIEKNAFGLADATPLQTMEEVSVGLLIGDSVFFVDGVGVALKIPDQGYPNMGVGESDTEKVVRGSNESFTESEKANTALVRKRIRSNQLKVKELKVGIRSFTNVAIVYIGFGGPHVGEGDSKSY